MQGDDKNSIITNWMKKQVCEFNYLLLTINYLLIIFYYPETWKMYNNVILYVDFFKNIVIFNSTFNCVNMYRFIEVYYL